MANWWEDAPLAQDDNWWEEAPLADQPMPQQPVETISPQIVGDTIVPPPPGPDGYQPTRAQQINPKSVIAQGTDIAGDMAQAGAAGLSRGGTGLVDLPGMAVSAGGDVGLWAQQKAGLISPEQATQARGLLDAWQTPRMGTGSTARDTVSDLTGGASEFHGDTTPGQYAGTVGEFIPGAMLGGGSVARNLVAYALAPGIASEAAGQATEGTQLEPYARIIAALAASTTAGAMTRPKAPQAPTAEALRQQADDLYRAGDARSAANAGDIQGLKGQVTATLQRESIITPQGRVLADGNVKKFLDVLDDFDGQQMTPRQMQNARQFLRDAAGSADPSDRRIGKILLDEFDSWRNPRVPEYQQADQLYGRAKRAEDVDFRVEKAERRAASSGTGGNSVNTARQNIRQILDNPKEARKYSPVELVLMEDIVRGSPAVNAMRLVGRLSPTSGALPLMGNIAGVGVAPQISIPAMGIAAAAKGGAEVLTNRQITNLSNTIRNGAPLLEQGSDSLRAIIAALLGTNAGIE